ncbi:MAG: non-ribosomal peptide synthetase, partial [Bacteroidetes bacterium]
LNQKSDTLRINSYRAFEKTIYNLTLGITAFNGTNLFFSYNSKLFSEEYIKTIAKHYRNILQAVISRPHEMLSKINILDESERDQILNQFNNTEIDYPYDKCIQHLFEEQARQSHDRTAVVFENEHITYGELNHKANQLAAQLKKSGVRPDSIVAILIERSVNMVISMLAVLKSGGAYLPIATNLPFPRIEHILKDSNTTWVITQQSLFDKCKTFLDGYEIFMEGDKIYTGDSKNLKGNVKSGNLAYVMYTSGTTGVPKGIMIEHRSVTNYLRWVGPTVDIQSGTNYLTISDYSVDPIITDVFGSLIHGAKLFLPDKNLVLNKEHFANYIMRHNIDMTDVVPSLLKELILGTNKLRGLNTILTGGEKLENWVKDQIIGQGYKLFNHYGLTETTVDALVTQCSSKNTSLGKPIANSKCYILDQDSNIVPVGVQGEICISGNNLARGYLNNPKLTEKKFIANPYLPDERLYRTGDLGWWLSDGNVAFGGRMDRQVKIRGLRLELEEIEGLLLNNRDIKDAVVIDKRDKNGQTHLFAYLTADIQLDFAIMRTYLAQYLPKHMIPSYFFQIDKLPLNSTGKIDERSLEAIVSVPDKSKEIVSLPKTDLERKVTDIWRDVLNLEKIGVDQNFFDIGGNSLYIIRLNSMLKTTLAIDIPVVALFEHSTIRSFTAYLSAEKKMEGAGDEHNYKNRVSKGRDRLKQRRGMVSRGTNV